MNAFKTSGSGCGRLGVGRIVPATRREGLPAAHPGWGVALWPVVIVWDELVWLVECEGGDAQ